MSNAAVAPPKPALKPARDGETAQQADPLAEAADELFRELSPEHRRAALEKQAANLARMIAAEEVGGALSASGKTLRQIQQETGLDPATISRVVTGHHENGPRLSTVATIALALGKSITLKIE